MKNRPSLVATLILAFVLSLPAVGQTDWDRKKYPDYSPRLKPSLSLMPKAAKTERPVRVNNAETVYFPPVFNQDGGSCGSASRIAYMFNYEINALRGLDGSLAENQYPTHFTWLLTNSGSSKDAMAIANGIPNVPTYGGRTYSRQFGNQDCADPDFGWMNGYDKWYAAMCNRLGRTANFPLSVATEEGREAVKNWLWNHNGDPDFKAGGICGIGVASTGIWKNIPSTDVNDELGVTGQYFVQSWGERVDHALTIVGYDDRIEFDLDGNGVAGEKDKDEVGAWIIVNSWGSGWCNRGFIYCPYKNAVTTGNSTNYYSPEVYHIRKDYRPLRTLKIKMDYSKRSELCLSAGIAADLSATAPERTVRMEHFKYAGDGDGNGADAETPMLGRWADGLHFEPMEFGYDLTDLSAAYDRRRPLKYFFIIDTKTQASGQGKIHECALMDYEFDPEGIELPFDMAGSGVTIENKGKRTIISVIAAGEPLNAPRNLAADGSGFAWDAPAPSPYALKAYNIYKGNSLSARLDATAVRFDEASGGAGHEIAAVYDYNGTEFESARVAVPEASAAGKAPAANSVRRFVNSGFAVKNLFTSFLPAATIEYWLKPTTCTNWNQQMGPGWNRGFMSHTTNAGEFVAGWNTTDRLTTAPGTLEAGKWAHVAVVVDGGRLTAYINGNKAGEIETNQTGINAFGDFYVGTGGTNYGINGMMDELRVWDTARSEREIRQMMYAEVADPTDTPHLMLELKMDEDGTVAPVDATGNHTTQLFSGTQSRNADNTLLVDTRPLKAEFALPSASVTAGTDVVPHNNSSANSVRWIWHVEGEEKTYEADEPVLVFDAPGKYVLHLTAYDMAGNSDETSAEVTVVAPALPVAGFKVYPDIVSVGRRVSFINTSEPAEGCRYEWSMPGAVTDKASSLNAATTYDKAGEYVVTLKATNAAGSHEVRHTITVHEKAPEADFEVTPGVLLKGGSVTLSDRSTNQPEAIHWRVSNTSRVLVGEGNTFTFSPDAPGRYDVHLDVSNTTGSDELTRKGALVVCNADAVTGLNFRGTDSEMLSIAEPIRSKSAFTIDWWMYAKGNRDFCNRMGNTGSDLLMQTTSEGMMIITLGNMSYKSDTGYVVPSEWHHYAVVFENGDFYLYRDCKLQSVLHTTWTSYVPDMPKTFYLGGGGDPMNAVIDEFRIWNSALTQDNLKAFANEPLEDVASAEKQHGLSVYYRFNQSSGNVTDATSNTNTGIRLGFGPEGDAWSPSLGAFCLDTSTRPDVTADYLTNYQMPFLSSDKTVNPADASRFLALLQETETSTWKLENPTVFKDIVTGVYVDTKFGNAMTLITKDEDFEAEVNDHKVYQTITLPAGYYAFGVEGCEAITEKESYIVAAKGKRLPNTSRLTADALSYATLADGETVFSVSHPTELSLGMLLNVRGEYTMKFRRFYLEALSSNDDFTFTGLQPVTGGPDADTPATVTVKGRTVHVSVPSPRRISAYTAAGLSVYEGYVRESVTLTLDPGFYIVAGRKVLVR